MQLARRTASIAQFTEGDRKVYVVNIFYSTTFTGRKFLT
jgi:hypothetical protein